MSLYNQIFGYNPIAPTLLLILQLDPQKIPRFRDAYIDDLGNIVIYTRTGGNNRATYASENQALREIPGFIRDEDDDYDETFAKFTYEVAEPFVPAVAGLPRSAVAFLPAWTFLPDSDSLSEPEELCGGGV